MGAVYLRKYNVTLASATAGSTKVRLSLRKAASATFATGSDWTPSSGDVKVSKDGGAEANVGTLPAYSNGQWEFVLSGTELSAMEVHVRISNAAVDDEDFVVETYGNASAMYPGDYTDGVRNGLTALPNAAAAAVGGLPLSVDTSGRVDVLKINNVSQTGRDLGASVLLSSGTGTGQLDITSGVVKANWVQILGSAITGTASQLAAAVTKFFNVATPTGTVNSLPDAVAGATGGLLIAGSNAATTFATLTVTGAFSINSVSNVAQTGDSFARIGAPTGASIAADIQTRLATSGYTVPPTVIQIRTEMDNNSTKLAHLDADITSRLAPTAAGRTLDVSAGGEAGLDWANIGSPTTTVNLSGTTIAVVSGAVGSISGITFPTNFSVLSISATTGLVTLAGTQTFSNTGTWTGNVTGSVNSVTTGVTLAASQSLYAPAKAGDAMTLTSAYDAAKTAATATAVAAITTILSGITSLANWLRLLGRKDTPNSTALTEFNATGGAYDATTDSTQAIRDRGDAAWTTGGGGGGSGLSGPSTYTLTFVDADANPVPLAEFTLLSADKATAIGSARADSNGVYALGATDDDYYVTTAPTSTVVFPDTAITVTNGGSATITGASNIPTPATTPGACNVYDTAIGIDGAAKAGVEYHFRVTQAASGTRNGSEQTATSVGTGTNNIVMALTQGDTVAIKRGTAAQWETFTVPASTSAQLSDLLTEEAAVGKDGSTP